jgi:hypothetical protein
MTPAYEGPHVRLTMEAISYSSGVPSRYRVLGLPDEKSAEIILKVTGSREVWRVRPRSARFKGFFQCPEDALAALQAAVDIETEGKAKSE